jgi:hypothetical protein
METRAVTRSRPHKSRRVSSSDLHIYFFLWYTQIMLFRLQSCSPVYANHDMNKDGGGGGGVN